MTNNIEGIRFAETPEQRRENMRASIDWKLKNGRMLTGDEYGLLKRENDAAALDLAGKIEAASIEADMKVYRETRKFK